MAGTTHPDAIVAAMVVDPSIMSRSDRFYVDVELAGQFARGYTVVDQWRKLDRPANTRVCLEADGERFRQVLMRVLAGA
jgi:purine nucleosidase